MMEHESYIVRQVALLTMEMTRTHYSLTGASGYPKICQMLRVRRGYLEGELQKIEDSLNENGELEARVAALEEPINKPQSAYYPKGVNPNGPGYYPKGMRD